jgi:hypothetical protein
MGVPNLVNMLSLPAAVVFAVIFFDIVASPPSARQSFLRRLIDAMTSKI